MRLSTWLCSPLRPGREEVGWLLGQPLPVAEAPMAARDDGKVLHLTSYLYAANRKKGGGQAVWGPVRPDNGGEGGGTAHQPLSTRSNSRGHRDGVLLVCFGFVFGNTLGTY